MHNCNMFEIWFSYFFTKGVRAWYLASMADVKTLALISWKFCGHTSTSRKLILVVKKNFKFSTVSIHILRKQKIREKIVKLTLVKYTFIKKIWHTGDTHSLNVCRCTNTKTTTKKFNKKNIMCQVSGVRPMSIYKISPRNSFVIDWFDFQRFKW